MAEYFVMDYLFLIILFAFLILITKKNNKKPIKKVSNTLDEFKKSVEADYEKDEQKKDLIKNLAKKKYKKAKSVLLHKLNDFKSWHKTNLNNEIYISEGIIGEFGQLHTGISDHKHGLQWGFLFFLDPEPDTSIKNFKPSKFSMKIKVYFEFGPVLNRSETILYKGNKINHGIENFLESAMNEYKPIIRRYAKRENL